MSMVLRIKRRKMTIFLTADATDSVAQVKQKLRESLEEAPEAVRLYKGEQQLEDSTTLSAADIENNNVLVAAFQLPDSDKFEEPEVTPLDDAKEARAYYE